jgi:ABC transporter with metal-binding/Fe-S-binding domain ATP-binding protein
MRYWALSSGGKDSLLSIHLAKEKGLEIDGILSFLTKRDSYLFHYPNVKWTSLQAESMKIPIKLVDGRSWKDLDEEKRGFKSEMKKIMNGERVNGIIAGLIASNFQRSVLEDLGIELFLPLWGHDQEEVLRLFIEEGFEGIVTGVAAEGLDESFLGREIDEELIEDLKERRINVAGEGGEIETFVVDGPIFSKRLKIKKAKRVWEGDRGFLLISEATL